MGSVVLEACRFLLGKGYPALRVNSKYVSGGASPKLVEKPNGSFLIRPPSTEGGENDRVSVRAGWLREAWEGASAL